MNKKAMNLLSLSARNLDVACRLASKLSVAIGKAELEQETAMNLLREDQGGNREKRA